MWELDALADLFERLSRFSRLVLHDRRANRTFGRRSFPNLETRAQDLLTVLDTIRSPAPCLFGERTTGLPSRCSQRAIPTVLRRSCGTEQSRRGGGRPSTRGAGRPTSFARRPRRRERDGEQGARPCVARGTVAPASPATSARGPGRAAGSTLHGPVDGCASGSRSRARPMSRRCCRCFDARRSCSTTSNRRPGRARVATCNPGSRARNSSSSPATLRVALRRPRRRSPTPSKPSSVASGRRSAGTVLGTVLFTDIVGSTERQAAAGDREWADVIRHHHAIVREALE